MSGRNPIPGRIDGRRFDDLIVVPKPDGTTTLRVRWAGAAGYAEVPNEGFRGFAWVDDPPGLELVRWEQGV